MIKFKASRNQKNLYMVYRIRFPFRFEKIGSVSIVPDFSYEFVSSDNISYREATLIQKKARRLIGCRRKGVYFYTELR